MYVAQVDFGEGQLRGEGEDIRACHDARRLLGALRSMTAMLPMSGT